MYLSHQGANLFQSFVGILNNSTFSYIQYMCGEAPTSSEQNMFLNKHAQTEKCSGRECPGREDFVTE